MQAAASVVIHVILFLLLPSLVSYSADIPVLELELLKPGTPTPVANASTGTPAQQNTPEVSSSRAEVNAPSKAPQSSKAPEQSTAPGTPAQEQAKDETAPASDSGPQQESRSVANQSTSVVVPDPIVVKENPQEKVPEQPQQKPSEQKPQKPEEQKAEPAKQENSGAAGGQEKPAPTEPKQDTAKPAPAKDPGDPSGDGKDQPAGNPDKPDGSSPGPGGKDDETKPADGVGQNPLPPGPTQAEMDLMKGYGDNARRRIKMLSRTPEVAREKGYKGSVKFEFEVNRDGSLKAMKVLTSSGYPVLDEECIEATRVAAPFGKFPPAVTLPTWKFEMTLKFPIS